MKHFKKCFNIFIKLLFERGAYVYSDEKITIINATREEVSDGVNSIITLSNLHIEQENVLYEAKKILQI